MLQDPFLERETEKYEFPVPSREFILSYLAKREKPTSRVELAEELSVRTRDQLEGLRRRLRAMERDGQLIFTRHRCYVLPDHLDLLRGMVIGHRDGFGFLRVKESKDDYYLSAEQMKIAIHGDIVIAQSAGRKGRREAYIIRVLVPKIIPIVGRIFVNNGSTFVVPDDNRFNFEILIPSEFIHNARIGFIVVVELIQRPTRHTKAIGKVVEVLGNNMNADMAMDIALRSHDIPYIWPPEVEHQLMNFQQEVTEEDKINRVDLRALPLMTIDDEEACDFDDAVYCKEKQGGGWRLWVAIADVSYYVRPYTPLDQEASKRTTSVYFPCQVVPMLPEVLCNCLCSLNPEVDRLSIVCEMTVSGQGRLSSYKFYEAVINSHARLTYNKVLQVLQGHQESLIHHSSLIVPLTQLHKMSQVLEKFRLQHGSIFFESKDAKFIFNTDRRIKDIELVKRNDAHKLIEECMILANIAAARFVKKHKEPVLYRVHDRPTKENISSLRKVFGELGLTLGGGDKPDSKDYANMMNLVAGRSDHEMLQTMLLRSMKQAIYDPENRGHFGLALQAYAHFTSPIRRYSDLILHRAIKYILALNGEDPVDCATSTGGWHSHPEELLKLGQKCSMNERRADEATRDVVDWLKCDFMQNYIGKKFSGMIIGVTSFGFFVRLDKFCIDGLVHVLSLGDDYYHYDSIGQRLIGDSEKKVYQLGDSVKVLVEAVYTEQRKISFLLTSSYYRLRSSEQKKHDGKRKSFRISNDCKLLNRNNIKRNKLKLANISKQKKWCDDLTSKYNNLKYKL